MRWHGMEKRMSPRNEASEREPDERSLYRIVIGGALHESWSEFLGKVDIDWERQGINSYHTILLSEVPDQAALRGLLNRIWDLNLEIISLDKYSQGETDDN